MTEIRKRIGTRLRELRTLARLSQERLGERAGVSYKFLGEVERGQGNPTIETLARIADALEIDVSELLRAEPAAIRYQHLSAADFAAVREAHDSLGHLIKRTRKPRARR